MKILMTEDINEEFVLSCSAGVKDKHVTSD